jgi:hypothetical protein
VIPPSNHVKPLALPASVPGRRPVASKSWRRHATIWLKAAWVATVLSILLDRSGALAQTGTPLVTLTNTVWRYNDSATDLGTAWHEVSYPDENAWPTGRGLFGVESTVPYPYPEPIRTPLVLNAGRTTYYFRTSFNFVGNPVGLVLRATAYIDDGAVFYLNGAELRRVRLPNGPITFKTKAQIAFPEGVPVAFDFEATSLVQGANVLAAEVHQQSDTSSDVVFGFALDVVSSQAPAILNPSEPADRTVPEGDSTTLSIFASGFPLPAYQWFKNGVPIPDATGSDLLLADVSAADVGSYFCRATNTAGSVTSRTAVVTFIKDTNGPVIRYALGKDSTTVLVVFSEPPNEAEATDYFDWEIPGLTVVSGTIDNGTNLTLATLEPREANTSYVVRRLSDLHELVDHGNVLPAETTVPIALFESALISNDDPHPWRYDHSGFDPGADWIRPEYNDTAWQTGAGAFDAIVSHGSSTGCHPTLQGIMFEPVPVRTCLEISYSSEGGQLPPIYFRTHFTFTGDNTNSILRLRTAVNDGAVFYLNGIEIARLRMPEGPITHDTVAISAVDNTSFEQLESDAAVLVAGDNLLAVELHQTATNPNMLDFVTLGLELLAVVPEKPLERPVLTFHLVGGNLELTWTPDNGALQSTDDPSGSWSSVTESHPPGQYTTAASEAKRFYRVVMP